MSRWWVSFRGHFFSAGKTFVKDLRIFLKKTQWQGGIVIVTVVQTNLTLYFTTYSKPPVVYLDPDNVVKLDIKLNDCYC